MITKGVYEREMYIFEREIKIGSEADARERTV